MHGNLRPNTNILTEDSPREVHHGRSTPQFGESASSDSLNDVLPSQFVPEPDHANQNKTPTVLKISQAKLKTSTVQDKSHSKIASLKKKNPQLGVPQKCLRKNSKPNNQSSPNLPQLGVDANYLTFKPETLSKNKDMIPLSSQLPGYKHLNPTLKLKEMLHSPPSFGEGTQELQRDKIQLFNQIVGPLNKYSMTPQPNPNQSHSKITFPGENDSTQLTLPRLKNSSAELKSHPKIQYSQVFLQSPTRKFTLKKGNIVEKFHPSLLWANPESEFRSGQASGALKYLHPKLQFSMESATPNRHATEPANMDDNYFGFQPEFSKYNAQKLKLKTLISHRPVQLTESDDQLRQSISNAKYTKKPSISKELPEVFRMSTLRNSKSTMRLKESSFESNMLDQSKSIQKDLSGADILALNPKNREANKSVKVKITLPPQDKIRTKKHMLYGE